MTTEKKTILLKTNQTLRMFRENEYIGSTRNFNDPMEIDIEKYPHSEEFCIDYYSNGVALHIWCTRYEVVDDEVVENDN